MPLHSRHDTIVLVLLTLRHIDNRTTDDAIRVYGDELGGKPCVDWLRVKQVEGRRRRKAGKETDEDESEGVQTYQALAIYEILNIEYVFGGLWKMNEAAPWVKESDEQLERIEAGQLAAVRAKA